MRFAHEEADAKRTARQKQPNSLTKRPLNQRSNKNLFPLSCITSERRPLNRGRTLRTRPDPAE